MKKEIVSWLLVVSFLLFFPFAALVSAELANTMPLPTDGTSEVPPDGSATDTPVVATDADGDAVPYEITASSAPSETGMISPMGKTLYDPGDTATFTMTPASSYEVEDVTVNGVSLGALTTYTFPALTQDHAIHVTFNPIVTETPQYKITATAGQGGTISPLGEMMYESGATPAYTVFPDQGYVIDTFTINSEPAVLADNTYMFSPLMADADIAVSFKPIIIEILQHKITSASGKGGNINPSGETMYEPGESPTYTVTPDTGYAVDTFTINGEPAELAEGNTYTFAPLAEDADIAVSFIMIQHKITASATPAQCGSITPAGEVTVNQGDSPTFAMTPAMGYAVEDVFVDGISVGAMTTYVFTSVVSDHTIAVSFAPIVHTISGYVRYPNSDGIGGIAVSFGDNGAPFMTDASGYYSQTVEYNWSGTITPSADGYAFSPAELSYSDVTSDQSDQNFAGTPEISPPTNLTAQSGLGTVKLTWEPAASSYLSGCNVYRSGSDNDPYIKINSEPVTGDHYTDDSELARGNAYSYYLTSVDMFGNESDPSDAASAVFGQVRLFIPDAQGESGDEVILPVNIANADGLEMCSVDIYVTYDPNVLSAKNIEKTALSADYLWESNLEEPGVARAVIAKSTGEKLYGEGALFYLLFDVIGNHGDASDLEFHVSGTFFYDCNDLINPADMDLGDAGRFTVTRECGFLGDLNQDCEINLDDVEMALDISVAKTEADQAQINAGDVSGDGFIRSNDAALILRLAEGENLAPQSLPGEKRSTSRSASEINVRIPEHHIMYAGQTTWIPIEIDNAGDVAGGDIVLNYDPTLVTASNARTTLMTEDFDMRMNLDYAGQVRISLSAKTSAGLPEGTAGALVEVAFTAKSKGSGASLLTLASVRLNDTFSRDFATSALQMDVKTNSGSLRVISLRDIISLLKILAGMQIEGIGLDLDVNGNEKTGMEDVIFLLQTAAGIR